MRLGPGLARLAIATCVATCVATASRDARAWYFPEHVVLAHDGLAELPPEIRGVLRDAVQRATQQGLPLCAAVDVGLEDIARRRTLTTKMVRSEISVDCVPYAALSALAGDHASSTRELRTVLTSNKAIELTSAAAYEWTRFREAIARLPNTSLERMSFVHDLDVAFYFMDPGYELRAQATRAHFADGGTPIEQLARDAASFGALDNSLGQFLAHHVRSLDSAARGDATEALLEHGFALHFLEDAFSAGHLVMTEALWTTGGNPGTRRRHDFFNAKGLAVRHAMNAGPCPTLVTGLPEPGVPPCWTTTGDGFLSLTPDSTDRLHTARAVALADLELAIAFDGDRVAAAVAALPPRAQSAIGDLVDPTPWWTLPPKERGELTPTSAARALKLVEGARAAVAELVRDVPPPAVTVGEPSPIRPFNPAFVADALAPCKAKNEVAIALDDEAPCGPDRALAIGTVGVSLLRPLLTEWPASRDDPATLTGEAKTDHGFAVQLLAGAHANTLFPPHAPVEFFAPSVGVAAGLAYRWGTYLPGRRDRPLAELNVGISEALHFDSKGRAGGSPHVAMLDQELRWPFAWELLTSYLLPLDLRRNHEEGTVVLLSGVRVHELLTNPTPVLWGMELEVASIALSHGRGNYPLYASSPEMRFYLGIADPAAAHASFTHTWAPTVGITFTGGYATFL
jgi:hypothetical protein